MAVLTLSLLAGAGLGVSTAWAQPATITLTPIPPVGPMTIDAVPQPANTRQFPNTKQFNSFNAAQELLDQHKKLKLTEEQVASLSVLQATLAARNADLIARYDSLLRVHKSDDSRSSRITAVSRSAALTNGTTVVVSEPMRLMWTASQQLLRRHSADATDAVGLLDDSRREAGVKVLDAQFREMLSVLPQPPVKR